MVKRTNQTSSSTLTFPSGNTFTCPVPAAKGSNITLKFAIGSSADTGLHWHEQHTEYFEVIQGVGKLTLEDENGSLIRHYVRASSGVVTIQPYKRHSLGRGDEGSLGKIKEFEHLVNKTPGWDELEWKKDLVVREWTFPRDGQKEIFFRNLAGVIHDSQQYGYWDWLKGWWTTWQLWVIFGAQDNYPAVFEGQWRIVEWLGVHCLCQIATLLGRVVGLKGSYSEYTPSELEEFSSSKRK